MSGGAFDYGCFRISQFAEELQNKIDENDTKEECGYCSGYSVKVLEALQSSHRCIELAGKLAHEIEWLYSGDIGEETFIERFIKITKEEYAKRHDTKNHSVRPN